MTLSSWKSSGEVNNKLYVITRVKFLNMHEDFMIGTQWTQLKKNGTDSTERFFFLKMR